LTLDSVGRHAKPKVRRGPRAVVVLPLAATLVFGVLLGVHVAFGRTASSASAMVRPLELGSLSEATKATPTPTPLPVATSTKPVPKAPLKPPPVPAFHRTFGLGARGPLVSDVQRRLTWTGVSVKVTGHYDAPTVAAVKRFQTKQSYGRSGRVDLRTYQRLVAVTKQGASLDPRCDVSGAVLCIDKSQEVLRYLVAGKLMMLVDVRFGSAELPTREGLFSVYYKSRYHVSNLFHTPMPYAMFFSGGQAVHYSKYFAAVGYNGHSHGCVNVRDLASVQRLFDEVSVGTRVVIYRTA